MSNRIEQLYTSTLICVPKGLSICEKSESLWNATFIKSENEIHQLVYNSEESFITIKLVSESVANLKCFTGEPDLENLMANGNEIIQPVAAFADHRLLFSLNRFFRVFIGH